MIFPVMSLERDCVETWTVWLTFLAIWCTYVGWLWGICCNLYHTLLHSWSSPKPKIDLSADVIQQMPSGVCHLENQVLAQIQQILKMNIERESLAIVIIISSLNGQYKKRIISWLKGNKIPKRNTFNNFFVKFWCNTESSSRVNWFQTVSKTHIKNKQVVQLFNIW